MKKRARQVRFLIGTICVLTMSVVQVSYGGGKYDGWFFYKGVELYQLCRSTSVLDQHTCATYVCGVVDAWNTEYVLSGQKTYSICLPNGITCDQLGASVLMYLEQNPKVRESSAGGAVGYALQNTLPCR